MYHQDLSPIKLQIKLQALGRHANKIELFLVAKQQKPNQE